jgi:SAM-dependent methyltransferase
MSWLRHLYFYVLYYRKPRWDTGISPPELLEFIEGHPTGRALDMGCGTGTNVITLAQHGWQVTGVDFVKRAIREADRKVQQAGVIVELFVDDVTKLENVRGGFDLVLDIGCFHSLEPIEQQAYVQNLMRLMKPDSYYLMYGFFRDTNGRGPGMLESDLDKFETGFDLRKREDGTERGQRPSAWLTYQRKSIENQRQISS